MNARRGLVVAVTVTALMNVGAPAWAVTEEECTGSRGGSLEGSGEYPVCVFAVDSVDQCDAVQGLPTRGRDGCILPIEPISGL